MDSPLGKFIRYLIQRPLLVNLILVLIVFTSIVAVINIQKVGLPRVDMHEMYITTIYPGASPEDVELNVTRKIEEALEEVRDLKRFTSESMENVSIIQVKIDDGAEDIEEVKDDIRRAVNDITDFPDEVEKKPNIFENKSDNWSIYGVGIFHDRGNRLLMQKHARELRRELLELPVVARVEEHGVPGREIKILLDKEAMKREYVSFTEVINAIQTNKIRLSAGSLESFTTEKGIVTFSEFETPEEIGNIIIRSNDAGVVVRLRDVARVKSGLEKLDVITRINGTEGMWLWIDKQGRADIVDAVEEIRRVIGKYKEDKEIPEGLNIVTLHDDSIETRLRLNILYSNAAAGLLLVLVILFFFFNHRVALWTAAGIPIAVGLAFVVASFFDVTLNRISLLGLVVVLGMLVDDSIIVAENIYRYEEKGDDRENAAVKGIVTVVKPVIATIITTVIAFGTMYFIPGLEMDFAREMPTFVIAMLCGSLVEAVIVLPAHLGHRGRVVLKKPGEPFGSRFLKWIEKLYVSLLSRAMKKRFLAFGFMTLFLVIGALVSLYTTRFIMFPVDQAYSIWFFGETPEGSSLTFTENEVKKIEPIIKELPAGTVLSYSNKVGRSRIWSNQILPNHFRFNLKLAPSTERDLSALEVKDIVFKKIQERGITSVSNLDYYIDGGGPPAGKPIEIQVVGNDNVKRLAIVQDLMVEIGRFGITEIDTDYRRGKEEIRIIPDYKTIALAQIDVSSIASVIRVAFDGYEAAHLDTADEQIPIRVKLDRRSVNFDAPLRGLFVMNRMGDLVPISSMVTTKNTMSPQTIFRYNGRRTNKITGNIDESTTPREVYQRIKKRFADFEKRYPGFKMVLGGEAERSSEMFQYMLLALILAITAIYFVLVIQFNSFIQPAMVILAIPFGLVGITLAFSIQRIDLSLMALTGIVGYTGVVVNNSLIMVDYINRIRKGGLLDSAVNYEEETVDNFRAKVIEGARLRLRPIFLTTMTTVAGLIPTAYGLFGGLDSFVSPMVMAMAWGLIIGTPSVLFTIPIMYTFFEDMKNFFTKICGKLRLN